MMKNRHGDEYRLQSCQYREKREKKDSKKKVNNCCVVSRSSFLGF